MRTNTTGVGDKQDVKDRELTQVQIYKLFTFVQKKYDYFTKFIIFIRQLGGGEEGPNLASELLSVSRTYAREARAHAHGLQTISSAGPPNSPPDLPITRRRASHRYLYRVFMGAMVNHRLRASGLRPRPWHLIKVLNATCGACLLSLRQKKKPGRKGRDFKKEKQDWSSYTLPQFGT